MVNDARVSVIIPTYGRSQYLKDAIASVTGQSYRNIELIIVDDASNPPVEIPAEVTAKLLRNARNMGPGASRNIGMAHATGEFILFLDDDDIITPERIRLAMAEIDSAHAHAAAVAKFFPDGRTIRGFPPYVGDQRSTVKTRPPAVAQVVFRRADLLQFDPTLRVSEDREWWIRMADRAVFAWTDELGLWIRRHDDERPNVNAELRYRTRVQVLQRHGAAVDRRERAHLKNLVASAALNAGYRLRAALWSCSSLLDSPNWLAIRRLARAVAPGKVAGD